MHLVINKLIGPCQTIFLKHRHIVDNAIINQEIVRHFKQIKGKRDSFIMKINLEKAFDQIEWSFVKHTLTYFNFPDKAINLIMSCISTSSVAVLVNGTKTGYFEPSRGLRQGDPISAYIFILYMEVLSHNINEAMEQGKWDLIKLLEMALPYLTYFL